MPSRRSIALAGAAALTLVAAPDAGAATIAVSAGPPVERPPAGVPADATANAFYPRTVTLHQRDRVRFDLRGFHNVVFPAGGQPAPPLITTDPANPVAGATDAAGAPFWFNGQPRLVLDPRSVLPLGGTTIDGRRLVGSGLPLSEGAPKPFVVSFPRRGTYTFLCTVHPGMRGRVRVAARRTRVPSVAAHRRAARAQFARDVVRVKRLARFEGPRGSRVQAGSDHGGVALLRFLPARKTIRAGESLELQMPRQTTEVHTFTFGPADYLRKVAEGIIGPAPGGEGPPTLVFSSVAALPSDPPPALAPFTGTNHGNGFHNTGILDRDPATPQPGSARVTFTRAGTYGYLCLLHPEMRGEVVVRP